MSSGIVHVGHINDFRRPRRSGVPLTSSAQAGEVVGHINGMPVVLRTPPPGRYVYDAQTGAVHFEHDIGPKATEAVTQLQNTMKSIELSVDHLRETVASLRSPAKRTLMVVAGVAVAGLLAAGLTYYFTRHRRKKA